MFGLNTYKTKTDAELIELYSNSGNADVVAVLFKRYTGMIYSLCYKYLRDSELCKDAAMDIFEVLIDKLKSHEVSNFKSWLHSVVRNHCLMQLRGAKQQFEFDDGYKNNSNVFMEDDMVLHQEVVEKEKMLTLMEQCLPKLNKEQRVCVELFYLKQQSYEQISNETGYDIKKVKSYIQNGKRNLKIMIEKSHDQQ